MTTNSAKNLRWIAFVLCIPSGASLLAYVFGLAPLHITAPFVVLPSCVVLILVGYIAAKKNQADLVYMLQAGVAGGVAGTIAYDLYRVPFQWIGNRVFVPIQVYGVWILNGDSSSSLSDIVGWIYHFSNGLTFAIAYALFVPGKHWMLGILWGLTLETIAVATPFGRIFALRGNTTALFIAYSGHVAYGLPLGWLVFRWKETAEWLTTIPASFYHFVSAASTIILSVSIITAWTRGGNQRQLTVQNTIVTPDIIRVNRGNSVNIYNTKAAKSIIEVPALKSVLTIEGKQNATLNIRQTGIFQIRVRTNAKTRSSFLIVEPVYDAMP